MGGNNRPKPTTATPRKPNLQIGLQLRLDSSMLYGPESPSASRVDGVDEQVILCPPPRPNATSRAGQRGRTRLVGVRLTNQPNHTHASEYQGGPAAKARVARE